MITTFTSLTFFFFLWTSGSEIFLLAEFSKYFQVWIFEIIALPKKDTTSANTVHGWLDVIKVGIYIYIYIFIYDDTGRSIFRLKNNLLNFLFFIYQFELSHIQSVWLLLNVSFYFSVCWKEKRIYSMFCGKHCLVIIPAIVTASLQCSLNSEKWIHEESICMAHYALDQISVLASLISIFQYVRSLIWTCMLQLPF